MANRLFTGLYAGRESLMTHANALSSTSDNLANANTTGFKPGRVEFGSLLADSLGGLQSSPEDYGNGSQTLAINTRHDIQGAIDPTGRPFDVAIQGNGYFNLSDGTNALYTRSGQFGTDAEGNLVTQTGLSVMGFTADSPDALVPLTTANIGNDAAATTTATLVGNLAADSALVAGGAAPADPEDFTVLNNAADFRTVATVIDSLGTSQDVSIYFFHTDVGTWTAQAYIDGGQTEGGVAGVPVLSGTAELAFDDAGQLVDPDNANLLVNAAFGNGAAASEIAVDLSGFTQFAGNSSLRSIVSNGTPVGNIASYRFDEDGNFQAIFDNGEEVTVGQVAISAFNSNDGLERVGDTNFAQTNQSGDPIIGLPGSEGRGVLVGSSLETSAVDTATEFINIVRFQRGYQAGSQVITTMSDLIDKTLQLA